MSDIEIRYMTPDSPRELVQGGCEVFNEFLLDMYGVESDLDADAWAQSVASDPHPSRYPVALVDGRVVGTGLAVSREPEYPGEARVQVNVLRAYRGRGVGRALMDAVEDSARELGTPVLIAGGATGGGPEGEEELARLDRIGAQRGYVRGILQIGRTLTMPLGPQVDEIERELSEDPDYTVRTAGPQLPQEWLEQVARLMTRFHSDVPHGELPPEDREVTAEQLREQTQREAANGFRHQYAAAFHAATGEMVAFTDLRTSDEMPGTAEQRETVVLGEHRGHRLGLRVKLANLRAARAAWPQVTTVGTASADTNPWMHAINERLGFEVAFRNPAYTKELA